MTVDDGIVAVSLERYWSGPTKMSGSARAVAHPGSAEQGAFYTHWFF